MREYHPIIRGASPPDSWWNMPLSFPVKTKPGTKRHGVRNTFVPTVAFRRESNSLRSQGQTELHHLRDCCCHSFNPRAVVTTEATLICDDMLVQFPLRMKTCKTSRTRSVEYTTICLHTYSTCSTGRLARVWFGKTAFRESEPSQEQTNY